MTKEKLFKENINIAHKNVQKFRHCGIDRGDLLQICYLGLWKSVLNFQEEKGCKFSSYAYKVIQNEILQYLRKNKGHQFDRLFSEEIGENITLKDIFADERDFIEELEEKLDNEMYIKNISSRVKDAKQKQVFKMYLQGRRQQEIADTIKCSQAQVSKILKKMKNLAC